MKHKTVEIFLFIDALGWKIVNDHGFLSDLLPFRKKIAMQFGYSSSAIPTILSGKTPAVHGHLGLFRFAPESSPFKVLSRLSFLFKPDFFWNRGRVRHHLSKTIKKLYGFTGYFQLYRMPLWKLRFVDYCEKKDLFGKGGMDDIPNLYDTLSEMQIPFHISDWHLKDDENFSEAEKALLQGKRFLFVYTAGFDGVLHTHVSHPEKVRECLEKLTQQIGHLYAAACQTADKVNFTVISDHGMTPLTGTADVMGALEKSGLIFGKDYGVCYDSTMARFYYLTDKAKETIPQLLAPFPGAFLTEEEKKRYGIDHPEKIFGDDIFLLAPGIQLVPSDMGDRPLPGMHGFSPENEHSHAVLLSNREIPEKINAVSDYFRLMTERAKQL